MLQYLIYSLIGMISGITGGLLGVGGGIIIVPALIYFMGVPIKTAIGTSLAIIVPTAIMGSAKHFHQGNIDWKIVCAIVPLAIAGSFLGAWMTQVIKPGHLQRGFAILMVYMGFRLFFKTSS